MKLLASILKFMITIGGVILIIKGVKDTDYTLAIVGWIITMLKITVN